MTQEPSRSPSSSDDQKIAELQGEIDRLNQVITKLQRKYDDLLRKMNDRDFERPPHYS